MTITLEQCTNQQLAALSQVEDWYHGRSKRQTYRQFGFAGSGKTSLARLMVSQLGLRGVKYAAYTGKAAQVLRSKGCPDVSTIHSLIYQPSVSSRKALDDMRKRLAATADLVVREALIATIKREEERLSRPFFSLKEESPLGEAPLLVLDEASMVGPQVGHDLESFGTPILVLGDPAQLPPIRGTGYFTDHLPDNLLTEVQRSASDSPVTHIATSVRRGEGVPELGDNGRRKRVTCSELLDYDQIIVGRRSTRWKILRAVRAMRGFLPDCPVAGDRIMVLCNTREADVFNGQQFTVLDVHSIPGVYSLLVADDDGLARSLDVWAEGFRGQSEEDGLIASGAGRGKVVAATFAQAITCHKSQGSQWSRVLVVNESQAFRDSSQRWLYTAVTRASEQVVVVPWFGVGA